MSISDQDRSVALIRRWRSSGDLREHRVCTEANVSMFTAKAIDISEFCYVFAVKSQLQDVTQRQKGRVEDSSVKKCLVLLPSNWLHSRKTAIWLQQIVLSAGIRTLIFCSLLRVSFAVRGSFQSSEESDTLF